jgi:hypothetical protein
MKTKMIVCSAVLGFLTAVPVYADTATTQGNQAPAIVGDNATVNYNGISEDKLIELAKKLGLFRTSCG